MLSLTVKVPVTLSLYNIDCIIIGAFEGGITYWCSGAEVIQQPTRDLTYEEYDEEEYIQRNYSKLKNETKILICGGSILLYDEEGAHEEDLEKYTLKYEKLVKGIEIYCSKHGIINDNSDLDAYSYDMIIQYALFDEVVYG